MVVEDYDETEWDKLEDEELYQRMKLMEKELQELSSVKYCAREQEMKERRQIARIDKRIAARKRDQETNNKEEGSKKRRKLLRVR